MGVITDSVKQLIAETATDPAQREDLESAKHLCLMAIAAHDVAAVESRKPDETARTAAVARHLDEVLNPPEPKTEDPIEVPVTRASPTKR